MKHMYSYIGISRQGLWVWRQRVDRIAEMEAQVLMLIEQIRKDHSRMGLRKIWEWMRPQAIGRDRFIELGVANGLGIAHRRSGKRTTWSGSGRFPNRIAGLELTHVNQVWVSDISYVYVGDGFGYFTVIMDLYSRRVLSGIASDSLHTELTSEAALRQALKVRGIPNYEQALIIHSDGGGQYYSQSFRQVTGRYGLVNSMGKTVYENAAGERVIGILKLEYLLEARYQNVKHLQQRLDKTLWLYNHERPHGSLPSGLSPVEFEQALAGWPEQDHPIYQTSSYQWEPGSGKPSR